MLVEEDTEILSLDFDLSTLQLHDFPNVKMKIDSLFYDWLLSTLSDGGQSLLAELKQSVSNFNESKKDSRNSATSSTAQSSLNLISPNNNTFLVDQDDILSNNPAASVYFAPPLSPSNNRTKSPKKRTQSEMMLKNNSDDISDDNSHSVSKLSSDITSSSNNANNAKAINHIDSEDTDDDINTPALTTRRRSNFDTIPVFYTPEERLKRKLSKLRPEDTLTMKLPEIEAFFKPFKDGIPIDKFVHVTKRLCNFPSYFNVPFCERILLLYGNNGNTNTNLSGNDYIYFFYSHFT